jgi:hypothetical protein
MHAVLSRFGSEYAMSNREEIDGFLAALMCSPDIATPSEYCRKYVVEKWSMTSVRWPGKTRRSWPVRASIICAGATNAAYFYPKGRWYIKSFRLWDTGRDCKRCSIQPVPARTG